MSEHEEQLHTEERLPTAPSHDENGFIFVPPTPQSSIDIANEKQPESGVELGDINKLLIDLSNSTSTTPTGDYHGLSKTVAAADSSTGDEEPFKPTQPTKITSSTFSPNKESAKELTKESGKEWGKESSKESGKECSACPYYMLACNYLSKIEVPSRVRELVLWKDAKYTGAVFGTLFVLLISLAAFSLLTVVSSLTLLTLTAAGAYRFYLAVIFRIKGTKDDTFDKLSSMDLSLPKDKVKQLAHLLETDVNKALNQLKSILLWDSVTKSSLAFVGFYFIYCVGCVFNTLTLLILTHVSLFTLPKVYEVYQVQIDQAIHKASNSIHHLVGEGIKKLPPMLKKKIQ